MSKLIVYYPSKDISRTVDNLVLQRFLEYWSSFFNEVMQITGSDRYQLDHDYAIKKATAERNLFSLMGWSDKLEDYIR